MWTDLLPVAYGFGTQELLIIGGLVVLLFGSTKLPQLARGMGESIREFKKSVSHEGDEENPVTPPGPDAATSSDKSDKKE